jgi:hypothetical protein
MLARMPGIRLTVQTTTARERMASVPRNQIDEKTR